MSFVLCNGVQTVVVVEQSTLCLVEVVEASHTDSNVG